MNLRKCFKNRNNSGQSALEYILLVVVAIVALLLSNFFFNIKRHSGINNDNAIEKYFKRAAYYSAGIPEDNIKREDNRF